jgi:hypothetical protein
MECLDRVLGYFYMFMHKKCSCTILEKAKPIDRSRQTDGSIDGSIDVSLHCEIVRYGTRKAETGRR